MTKKKVEQSFLANIGQLLVFPAKQVHSEFCSFFFSQTSPHKVRRVAPSTPRVLSQHVQTQNQKPMQSETRKSQPPGRVACAQVTGVPRCAGRVHPAQPNHKTPPHPTTDHQTPSSLQSPPCSALAPARLRYLLFVAGHSPSPRRLGFASAAAAGARVSGAGRRGMSSSRRPAGSRVLTTPLTNGGW